MRSPAGGERLQGSEAHRLPPTSRAGLVLLLGAVAVAPWPYGGVADVWRYLLATLVFLASALVALRSDLRPGLGAVLPLAAVPLVQILSRSTTPAQALPAALALWSPLAAWLALRALGAPRRTATVVAGCALLQAVFALVQASAAPHSIYGHSTPWMTSSFGSFINHNHFAGYAELGALLSLGLCADRLRRGRELSSGALFWAGAAALVMLAHVASRSRGGFLALAAGLLVFGLLLARRISARHAVLALAAAATVLLAVLLIMPATTRDRITGMASARDGATSYRLRLAAASLRLAAAHPLLGAGLGSYPDAVAVHKRSDGDVRSTHAENDVLEFAAETGLLGIAALAWAIGRALRALRNSLRASALAKGATAAAVALAVHSLFDFNLRVPATALALAACLAVALGAASRPSTAAPPRTVRAAFVSVLVLLGLLATAASVASLLQARAARLSDPLERAAALSRALSWNPLATEVRRDRARALAQAAAGPLANARLARAAADYRRALGDRPAWAEAWYELAWVELAQGNGEATRRALDRAAGLDPTSVPLAAARAALLERLRAGPSQTHDRLER